GFSFIGVLVAAPAAARPCGGAYEHVDRADSGRRDRSDRAARADGETKGARRTEFDSGGAGEVAASYAHRSAAAGGAAGGAHARDDRSQRAVSQAVAIAGGDPDDTAEPLHRRRNHLAGGGSDAQLAIFVGARCHHAAAVEQRQAEVAA